MKRKIFTIAEAVLTVLATIGVCMGKPLAIAAPLILLGFCHEEKIIAFEEKIKEDFKRWVKSM